MHPNIEQKLKALDAFKDWSNYLLITTVAAVGWTAEKQPDRFCTPFMKPAAVICFALSIVFAIMTLALVPHVAEDIEIKTRSIYRVYWSGWWVSMRLTRLCLPQHVFFLLGILFYSVGTSFCSPCSIWWLFGMIVGILASLYLLGQFRPKPPVAEIDSSQQTPSTSVTHTPPSRTTGASDSTA